MNTTSTLEQRCFPKSHRLLMSEMEAFTLHFIFPAQFIVTVFGNMLTMSVLLSSHMRNRANHLLALLALCDIMVFVMMLPHCLASFDFFAESVPFVIFHYHAKPHFGALTNWFSAAAIWFVLAVSVERLLIIKFPFRSLDVYNSRQIVCVGCLILLGTLGLTSYHHVSHTCRTWVICNETQAIGICYSNLIEMFGKKLNPTSDMVKSWINVSVISNAFLAVLLPIFAVAVINISLLRLIKKRNSEELLVHSVNVNTTAIHEQERKMTNTVLTIVTCFTMTQGPSAIVYIIHLFVDQTQLLRDISIITNTLVLTGKMLNVVLFCLTSKNFRRKLFVACQFWICMLFHCNRRNALRSKFSRSQKSVVTQKTSIMHSPSGKNYGRRISALSDSISMKQLNNKSDAHSILIRDT